MTTVRNFKYLVGFNRETKQFQVGYTRDWKFHSDILPAFLTGFKPYSGGHFSIELDVDFNWVVRTVRTFGKSEGYRLEPSARDDGMIKLMIQAENDKYLLTIFDTDGKPTKQAILL